MLLNRPIVSPMVKGAIDEIKKNNQECTIEEIIWLHQLAQKVVNPIPFKNHDMLDMPIQCGSLTLYPLTIGSRIWYEKVGYPIVNNPPKWRKSQNEVKRWLITVLGFLHVNAKNVSFLKTINSVNAYNEILKWENEIDVTHDQLGDVIFLLSDLYEETNEDIKDPPFFRNRQKVNQAAIDYGDSIARLMHCFGNNPEYWLWQINENEFWAFVQKASAELSKFKNSDEHCDIGKEYSNRALAEFKSLVWWIKTGRPKDQPDKPIENKAE